MTNIPKADDQVDQWRSVMFLYDSALKKVNTKIEILNNEFANRYDYNLSPNMEHTALTAWAEATWASCMPPRTISPMA